VTRLSEPSDPAGIAVADVSGKGIPAALIMAAFRASLKAEIRNNYAIRTIMAKVNFLMHESIEPGKGPDLPALSGISDGFPYYLEKSKGRNWPGYSGKLSEITASKGEKLVSIALDKLATLVRRWLADPEAPGSW